MSWAEVRKINSDFANEPLNFNNYINDISTFKENSYVLDTQNEGLWRSLISQSLTLFGHRAIHEVIYERLTASDVDYMLLNNGRLGESFNSFYRITDFVSGGIDAVLGNITADSYNKLELKIQAGINRYISNMTADNTAGAWLGTTFGISTLKSKTNMASILSDTTLWNNTIMTNESLRYVICLSTATINWFSSTNSDAFLSFITEVANSTEATVDLFNALDATDKLTTFMNTENAVSIMASKKASMEAICYMINPFNAMLSSEIAMNTVFSSEIAVDAISKAIMHALNSEVVLSGITENLSNIENSLPIITSSEMLISETATAKKTVADTVTSLQVITSQTGKIVENITSLLSNDTAAELICNSAIALSSIFDAAAGVINNNTTYLTTFRKAMKKSSLAISTSNLDTDTGKCFILSFSQNYISRDYNGEDIASLDSGVIGITSLHKMLRADYYTWDASNAGNKVEFGYFCNNLKANRWNFDNGWKDTSSIGGSNGRIYARYIPIS